MLERVSLSTCRGLYEAVPIWSPRAEQISGSCADRLGKSPVVCHAGDSHVQAIACGKPHWARVLGRDVCSCPFRGGGHMLDQSLDPTSELRNRLLAALPPENL